jgi:hypothetical protein
MSPAKIGRCFCTILTRFGVSGQVFLKVPNIKFHCDLSSGTRAVACGHADRRSWRS